MTHRVHLYDRPVGVILSDRGKASFRYDEGTDEAYAISVRMPVRNEPYDEEYARPFFENLLPEAEFRRVLAGALGISPSNTTGLLGAIGGECAGAVSIWPQGLRPSNPPEYEPLTADHVQSFFANNDDSALIDATKRSRLSIAGAQEKLALYKENETWFLPVSGSPSTHILKRARYPKPNLIENEVFSMRLAQVAGLSCASATIVDFSGTRVFVTERFDRQKTDGGVTRLHQEDFCQALGILPSVKYQAEGGPSYSNCAAIVQELSNAPIRDLPSLAAWMIFNYLIGNADAHAKNVSFLYSDQGLVLAPFYDIVSTLIYKDLSGSSAEKCVNRFWVFEGLTRRTSVLRA